MAALFFAAGAGFFLVVVDPYGYLSLFHSI
jgi:hypothetical protein